MACPVYDWHHADEPVRPVHLVGDEDNAANGAAAYCGATPGELGWVIWHGNVPESTRCKACYSKL